MRNSECLDDTFRTPNSELRTAGGFEIGSKLIHLLLLSLCVLGTPHSLLFAESDNASHWNRAKSLIREGDCPGALLELERIILLDPADPWVDMYRNLCQRRMQSDRKPTMLSASEMEELVGALRQEEKRQQEESKRHKMLDREVKKAQRQWDEQLKEIERKKEQEQALLEKLKPSPEKIPPAPKTQEQEITTVQPTTEPSEQTPDELKKQLEPATQIPSTTEQPSESEAQSKSEAQVESPKTEPATEIVEVPEPSSEEIISPTTSEELPPDLGPLVEKAREAGEIVEIHADQMRMSPDRKMAVAEAHVLLEYGSIILTCDRMTLFTDTHDLYAEGNVRLEDGARVFEGEMVHYNMDTEKGRFLQGRVAEAPWYESGRLVEQLSEGVYRVTSGALTSCDHEPPHFQFVSRSATVFTQDRIARARHVGLFVDKLPVLYLPWLSMADRQTPFYLIPGKRKPWGQYSLMGYRHEWPNATSDLSQKSVYKLDWRRHFGWGVGMDHQVESERLGQGLLKVYYNDLKNRTEPNASLPKGATEKRYRLLWRHLWRPMEDTTIVTDIQEFSDRDFRKDLLFREEYTNDDNPETFISSVTAASDYSLNMLLKKRMNRFQTVTETLPQVTFSLRPQRLGSSLLYSESALDVANFQTVTAHSDLDTDVVRVDWLQQFSYVLNWLRPIEITPKAGIRQTYYTKDSQGGSERPDGKRDVLSGQPTLGLDASLKLFRVFPLVSNALGLNLFWLRHVLTPTLSYQYTHNPTVPNDLLAFAVAGSPSNAVTFGIENKLQTKRSQTKGSVRPNEDLARFLISIPYTFHGHGNKQGGRLGNWSFDLELSPWPWMRLEADWSYKTIFPPGQADFRVPAFNMDLTVVGGGGLKQIPAVELPRLQAPEPAQFGLTRLEPVEMMPQGEWYLGLGHRYSHNDKAEEVLQWDYQMSEKWQLGSFFRFTLKEVSGGSKRYTNLREYQLKLRRDLHDWIGELVYQVDREFGEELLLLLTLKAYPGMPLSAGTSYHQPKFASQSNLFSPLRSQHPASPAP